MKRMRIEPTIRRAVVGFVVAGLLASGSAEAQRLSCGGHFITRGGRVPVRADSGSARFDPQHEDGQQPTIPEPVGMYRKRWDALVFNRHELGPRHFTQTRVLDRRTVPTIKVCVQSPTTSRTGERLEPYSNAPWWRENIRRWTGLSWNGEIKIAACTDDPQEGWIYVKAGDDGEAGNALARAVTYRESHPHDAGRWRWTEIFWNPFLVPDTLEDYFEALLAHELGHALGFSHVPRGSGYIMNSGPERGSFDEEMFYAQLAYRVGPRVRSPALYAAASRLTLTITTR